MKVVVDLSMCDLHGLCVDAAPEVFQIGDDGVLHVLLETPADVTVHTSNPAVELLHALYFHLA